MKRLILLAALLVAMSGAVFAGPGRAVDRELEIRGTEATVSQRRAVQRRHRWHRRVRRHRIQARHRRHMPPPPPPDARRRP
jgi:hypothetical protein